MFQFGQQIRETENSTIKYLFKPGRQSQCDTRKMSCINIHVLKNPSYIGFNSPAVHSFSHSSSHFSFTISSIAAFVAPLALFFEAVLPVPFPPASAHSSPHRRRFPHVPPCPHSLQPHYSLPRGILLPEFPSRSSLPPKGAWEVPN